MFNINIFCQCTETKGYIMVSNESIRKKLKITNVQLLTL